jgi:transposase
MKVAMARTKPWSVSDELWNRIEPLVPRGSTRDPHKSYQRKPGGGRKPLPDRQAFEGIVFVLRTGIQWNALPARFGSSSAVHRRFLHWERCGLFRQIWQAGLAEYDGMHGIAWEWQSVDGALHKAPLALECVGPNPTDRGKKWTQAQLAHRRQWHPTVARRSRSQPA